MSLAKQIGSVSKTALTNAGHMNMNNEIYARILDTTVTALHLEALAPGYKECLDREAECVNRVTKSASTAQLEAKDKERDKTLQFIYSMNGSYKVCPDETLRAPALLVDSVLRAYDKIYAKAYAEETYTDIAFDILRRKYDFAQPFTKESLLYLELFERYYPDQARMVSGFWMPNKAWPGCNVNDPSARVLANYGASGV